MCRCSFLQKQLVSRAWKHFELWSYGKTKEQAWLNRTGFEDCTGVTMLLWSSRCCVILCWLDFYNPIQSAFLFLTEENGSEKLCSAGASWNPVSTANPLGFGLQIYTLTPKYTEPVWNPTVLWILAVCRNADFLSLLLKWLGDMDLI